MINNHHYIPVLLLTSLVNMVQTVLSRIINRHPPYTIIPKPTSNSKFTRIDALVIILFKTLNTPNITRQLY